MEIINKINANNKENRGISVRDAVKVVKEVYKGTRGSLGIRVAAAGLAMAALSFEGVMRVIGHMVGDADLPKKR